LTNSTVLVWGHHPCRPLSLSLFLFICVCDLSLLSSLSLSIFYILMFRCCFSTLCPNTFFATGVS
jgi:hypothetical protein